MAKIGMIAWFDNLPWIVKVLFCIPFLDVVWAVYRIVKGATEGNILLLVVGILWVIGGCTFTWVWDLVTTIIFKRPLLS